MSKKLINGLKYEKLTEDQLHDLSQWELVDIILAYRKDLKAKKKECEELKGKCKKYGEINEQETKDYAELKTENDELKDLNTRLDNQRETYWKGYQKLKQTLTEIKPILEYYANSTIGEEQEDETYRIELSYKYGSSNMYGAPCYYKYNPKPAREALQKISEVLE